MSSKHVHTLAECRERIENLQAASRDDILRRINNAERLNGCLSLFFLFSVLLLLSVVFYVVIDKFV